MTDQTILPASTREAERQAAQERVMAYPYNFPRRGFRLGGKFNVKDNAQTLLRFFYFERRLAQGLGSWTLAIPDFEVKVETGRHIFYHADAALALRERLSEQDLLTKTVDSHRNPSIDRLIEEVLSAKDTPELLVGIHAVLGKELERSYRHHIDLTDPICDSPTIRVLQLALLDYTEMLDWANRAIEAYIKGGVDESRLQRWQWHIENVLKSIGGIDGLSEKSEEPSPMRVDEQPYERGITPERDSRFVKFTHTGDYDIADEEPRFEPKSYESERFQFIRAQRDEVDAIEAFGTFLWDIRFVDFMAEYHLARITWDECRHTEIGHEALLVAGYNPYELPNRATSSTCRASMEPEFGMAEINLFGELAVLRHINELMDEAATRKDTLFQHIGDFIRADESTHVRKGEYIRKHMTDLGYKELEYKTREKFTECLRGLGALPNGDLFDGRVLSREEIEKYVGE